MPFLYLIVLFGAASAGSFADEMKNSALFFKEINKLEKRSNDKVEKIPDIDDMDKTVSTLLTWLQERYRTSRKARQENVSRNYLPSLLGSTTQQPRPFQQTTVRKDFEAQNFPSSFPTQIPGFPTQTGGSFPTLTPGFPTQTGVSFPESLQGRPATEVPSGPPTVNIPSNSISEDLLHPPHIHKIDVQCGKQSMTINIEFNRVFDGVIYSKGFYGRPECRYVLANSGRTTYSFTVMLDSCGTQFIDQFSEGKQAYLENVLVLQNEPGIQEVWDVIRSVRCLWEGSISKALSVALSVGTLSQEIVTFSGDTATARLDIQIGRGPYAPAANGLVKIGDTMTLVVTVEGDPGFSVLVRDCQARDNSPDSGNIVQLTDSNGCVLRPKLMGAFQTTTDRQSNSVIAYAFFQAFKFPDVMDLTVECNVELCKAQCRPCSDPNQKIEPGRRKRSVTNSTGLTEPVTLAKTLMVFLPQDIEDSKANILVNLGQNSYPKDSICLSSLVFVTSTSLLLSLLVSTTVAASVFWLKMHKNKK